MFFKILKSTRYTSVVGALCLFVVCFRGGLPTLVRNTIEAPSLMMRVWADMNEASSSQEPTRVNLIINTYMRSGSSFIGRLFARRSDTFYVYEPLWNALHSRFYSGTSRVCHYSQIECFQSDAKDLSGVISLYNSLSFLNAIMNCTFSEDSYAEFLNDRTHFKSEFPGVKHSWRFYESWDAYRECASLNNSRFRDCLELMTPVCMDAPYRVSKVLRTSLDNLEILLKQVPNLKIIQSFRDPRGIINSRLHTPFYRSHLLNEKLVQQDIVVMCDRMKSDLKAAKKLIKLYPGRLKIIQYEDMWNLTDKAKLLFDFVGMVGKAEVTSFLSDLEKLNSSLSSFHPFAYQRSLDWSTIEFADDYCSSVIKALDYPTYPNETMYRNSADNVGNVRLTYPLS